MFAAVLGYKCRKKSVGMTQGNVGKPQSDTMQSPDGVGKRQSHTMQSPDGVGKRQSHTMQE